MLQHIQRNFDLYWGPAWNLSIDELTIGFKARHKDKIRITVKYVGDIFKMMLFVTVAEFTLSYIAMMTYLT